MLDWIIWLTMWAILSIVILGVWVILGWVLYATVRFWVDVVRSWWE